MESVSDVRSKPRAVIEGLGRGGRQKWNLSHTLGPPINSCDARNKLTVIFETTVESTRDLAAILGIGKGSFEKSFTS
jgi:hypothetical protein